MTAASISLAILLKITGLYLGLVVLYLFVRSDGLQFLRKPATWFTEPATFDDPPKLRPAVAELPPTPNAPLDPSGSKNDSVRAPQPKKTSKHPPNDKRFIAFKDCLL